MALGISLDELEANRLVQVLATYLALGTGHREDLAFARQLHEKVREWAVRNPPAPADPPSPS